MDLDGVLKVGFGLDLDWIQCFKFWIGFGSKVESNVGPGSNGWFSDYTKRIFGISLLLGLSLYFDNASVVSY